MRGQLPPFQHPGLPSGSGSGPAPPGWARHRHRHCCCREPCRGGRTSPAPVLAGPAAPAYAPVSASAAPLPECAGPSQAAGWWCSRPPAGSRTEPELRGGQCLARLPYRPSLTWSHLIGRQLQLPTENGQLLATGGDASQEALFQALLLCDHHVQQTLWREVVSEAGRPWAGQGPPPRKTPASATPRLHLHNQHPRQADQALGGCRWTFCPVAKALVEVWDRVPGFKTEKEDKACPKWRTQNKS